MKYIDADNFRELGHKMSPEDLAEITENVGDNNTKDHRKIYYAVHRGEIVPCHLIEKKDRDGRGAYAANSKRDKRRFQTTYAHLDDAYKAVAQYEIYTSQPDTF